MKLVAIIGISILIFILQMSFVPALRPLGVVPNLGLVLIAIVGLYGTASSALVLAVTGGLMLDLVSGSTFGLYVGLFVIVALAAGFIHRAGINSLGPLVAIALVISATFVQDLVILGGLSRIVSSWPVGHLIGRISLEALLNSLLVLVITPLVRWLSPPDTGQYEVRG